MHKGFVIVASYKKQFLTSAILCAESLKDHYPEAHVTLFTETEWIDDSLHEVFDIVVGEAPNNNRAKLWALSRTPYDLSVYLDADMEVMSSDITTVFDQMKDSADIMMTKIRPYNAKITKFPGGDLTDHCGFFMYRKTPKTINFMEQWWELFRKQQSKEWNWDTALYPEELRQWDQWAYWWLQNKTEHSINRKYFDDDARWNFVNGYLKSETTKPVIIYHHTVR